MGNITIFEESSNLPTVRRESRLSDKISSGNSLRRIAINTNGTFKRMVGGEQIGKAVPHEINVIIVDMLKDVSREYYAAAYDPDSKPTLPDCWSNDGRTPDAKSSNRQASSCADCPMNVAGSGPKGRKACRFKRRIAVLAAGDPSGDIYQMSFAAQSLFGKGTGTVHPYESYCNYLKANGEAPDTVVTKVMYDTEADTLTLKFKPLRHLTQEEADLVDAAYADPETQRYIQLTASEGDSAANKPANPAKATPQPKPKPKSVFDEDEGEDAPDEEEIQKPVKRATTKKAAPVVPDVEEESSFASLLDEWAEDEEG